MVWRMSLTEAAPHLRAWPVSDGYAKYMSHHEASVYGFLDDYRVDLEFAEPSIRTPELLRRNTLTGIGVTSYAGEFASPTLERCFDGAYLQTPSGVDALLSALQHIRAALPAEKAPLGGDYEVMPGGDEPSSSVYLQQACSQIGFSS